MIPSKKLIWVNKILEVAFMKDKIVITIARQYGSGGRTI